RREGLPDPCPPRPRSVRLERTHRRVPGPVGELSQAEDRVAHRGRGSALHLALPDPPDLPSAFADLRLQGYGQARGGDRRRPPDGPRRVGRVRCRPILPRPYVCHDAGRGSALPRCRLITTRTNPPGVWLIGWANSMAEVADVDAHVRGLPGVERSGIIMRQRVDFAVERVEGWIQEDLARWGRAKRSGVSPSS